MSGKLRPGLSEYSLLWNLPLGQRALEAKNGGERPLSLLPVHVSSGALLQTSGLGESSTLQQTETTWKGPRPNSKNLQPYKIAKIHAYLLFEEHPPFCVDSLPLQSHSTMQKKLKACSGIRTCRSRAFYPSRTGPRTWSRQRRSACPATSVV